MPSRCWWVQGEMQPRITAARLVNAIPYAAIQRGLMTGPRRRARRRLSTAASSRSKAAEVRSSSLRIFRRSAERSPLGCTIKWIRNRHRVPELQRHDAALDDQGRLRRVRTLEAPGAQDGRVARQSGAMEAHKDADTPRSSRRDSDSRSRSSSLGPNDPDDLSRSRRAKKIDEVFIGSCMTNIGTTGARQLLGEGERSGSHGDSGSRRRPRWTLQLNQEASTAPTAVGAPHRDAGLLALHGNQARVKDNSTVVRRPRVTSRTASATAPTCTWPRRTRGRSPRCSAAADAQGISRVHDEINTMGKDIYRTSTSNEIESFQKAAEDGKRIGPCRSIR